MGIGQAPLIPLYRFRADPEARFQRFGVNDSQLIGKPLLDLTAIQPPNPQEQAHRRTEFKPGAEEEKAAFRLELGPDYARPNGSRSRQESAAVRGTKLDLKA